ncbi:MAG TPA: MFS transporter [Azospirillaceae bacterium]|nr:MFS transporter [Azospirillaceae bacterium]
MAAVQFVTIMSFMMVMPLGPAFSLGLGIDPAHIGWIAGSYTAAASLSGLAAALFIDRFDRRTALAAAMGGLILSNLASAAALGFATMVAARTLAGLFAGPAMALAVAIVADNVPPERRGQAMGTVMGSLSLASVLGVPAGLELSDLAGWRAAFLAVAVMGAAIVAGALWLLAPQRAHLAAALAATDKGLARLARIAGRPGAPLALALVGVSIMPGFLTLTNLATFATFNLGFPQEHLSVVYFAGGVVSFFGMRWTGRLVDRFGSSPVTAATSLALAGLVFALFYDWALLALPVLVLAPAYMLFNTARMVAQNTAVSKTPEPAERAGFMALVQTVQQGAGAVASVLGALLLETAPDGRLLHMERVGLIAILFCLAGPPLMMALEARLKRRAAPPATAPARP